MENNIFTRAMFLHAMAEAKQRLDQQIGQQNQFYPIYETRPLIERETKNLRTTTSTQLAQTDEQDDSVMVQDTFETDNIMREELHDEKPGTSEITIDETIAEERKPECRDAASNQHVVHMVSIPSEDNGNSNDRKHEKFENSRERAMPDVRKREVKAVSQKQQRLEIKNSSILTRNQDIFDEKSVYSRESFKKKLSETHNIVDKDETQQNQCKNRIPPNQDIFDEKSVYSRESFKKELSEMHNIVDKDQNQQKQCKNEIPPNQDIFDEKCVYSRESFKKELSKMRIIDDKSETQQDQFENRIPPKNSLHNKMSMTKYNDQLKSGQSTHKQILSPNVKDDCFLNNETAEYPNKGIIGEPSQSAQDRMLQKPILFDIDMLRSALAETRKVLQEEKLLSLKNSSTPEIIDTNTSFSLKNSSTPEIIDTNTSFSLKNSSTPEIIDTDTSFSLKNSSTSEIIDTNTSFSLKNSSTPEIIDTNTSFSLERFLINILTRKDMPMSVSFINLFLSQRKVEKITKEFFGRKSVQDTFSIYILGCDLKIRLKELNSNLSLSEPSSFESICNTFCINTFNYVNAFDEIIQKDIAKLKDLRVRFENDDLSEILYDDFIERYSSNKYKMKLPFIVRNSHALLLYKSGEDTYIRFIDEDEQTPEIFDMNDSMEILLATSLRNLLCNFRVEINQGVLNSCFNYGDIVVDSNFLFYFSKNFSSTENNGVILVNDEIKLKPNLKKRLSESPTTVTDVRNDSKDNSLISLEASVVTEDNSHNTSPLENAIQKEHSVIMVGNSSRAPIRYHVDMKTSEKIKSLERICKYIDAKIKESE